MVVLTSRFSFKNANEERPILDRRQSRTSSEIKTYQKRTLEIQFKSAVVFLSW